MKITIEGDAKEVAALLTELAARRENGDFDERVQKNIADFCGKLAYVMEKSREARDKASCD